MDEDLVTVREFAELYRVDESEVRRWIKGGHIPYELVGVRKMKRIRRSMVVKPIEPVIVGAQISYDNGKTWASFKLEEDNNAEPGTQSGLGAGETNRDGSDQDDAGHVETDKKGQGRRGGPTGNTGAPKGRR